MKVNISYVDTTSLSPEEIKAQSKALYGQSASVKVQPDSDDVYSVLYFAIQEHITIRQVQSYIDDGLLYKEKIEKLRSEVLDLTLEAFEQVVCENEEKLE